MTRSHPEVPEAVVPLAELQRYVAPVEAAATLFRARAAELRERFEPTGAELVEEAAGELDELVRVIRGEEP